MTDPIADMLTRIRNAYTANHKSTVIPHSKLKATLAELLKEAGYIKDFSVETQENKKLLKVDLKYIGKMPAITHIRRISSPGRRTYVSAQDIPSPLAGHGSAIISTSKGILLDKEARKQNVGGEIICEVW